MPRLIVNADDFGLTDGVNVAIERAHRTGVLTSTTVLVNQGAAAGAEAIARSNPELGFGLHVNLTLGQPVSDPADVRSLVDADGRFRTHGELLKGVWTRRVDQREIRREVAAQLDYLRRLGVEPTHWDSHEAAAFWPGLVEPAAAAAAAGGIRAARSPRVWIMGTTPRWDRLRWTVQRPRRLATQAARWRARRTLRKRFALPDWRLSPNLDWTDDRPYRERWLRAFSQVPDGCAEIVSHPAVVDDELREVTPGLTDPRAVDAEVLESPEVAETVHSNGISLISFRQL